MSSKIVLITGCSAGIGRDLAIRLARANYTVIATARRPESMADLPVAMRLPLDVTDASSIAKAMERITGEWPRVDVLVNNAGYAVRGAVEEVSDLQVKEMFDVNVFGVMRMIRAVAPLMRQAKSGHIVNIGSIAGKLALPVNGTYSATKFALEALSDAMRLELAPFGIQVVLVEPGNIRTNFAATAQAQANPVFANANSPYHALYRQYVDAMATMREKEPGPEIVSKVVQQCIEAAKPNARYPVGVPLTNRLVLLLGDKTKDSILRRLLKIDITR